MLLFRLCEHANPKFGSHNSLSKPLAEGFKVDVNPVFQAFVIEFERHVPHMVRNLDREVWNVFVHVLPGVSGPKGTEGAFENAELNYLFFSLLSFGMHKCGS